MGPPAATRAPPRAAPRWRARATWVDALMHLHELTPPASEDGGSGDDGESKDAEESTGTGT